MEKIQYSGLDQVDKKERMLLDKLSAEYYPKIQRMLHNELNLHINIKRYNKEGTREKWSIHVQANAPTIKFTSDKASDWDFARTLHKAFKDLENQIKKKMKID